jgi:microcystin-dependent protein
MALRQRNYFFDPTNTDRFNSQDIPTEQTMSDWCDSVPFIKEITDRAQLTRAGIAKTTTDAKINNSDNVDAAGVSPLGFTTFVRPSQIPKILDSASVTWTKVPRSLVANTDTGIGIEDWRATVQFPTPANQDADQITSTDDLEISRNDGLICSSITSNSTILPAGTDLQTILTTMQDAIRSITDRIPTLSLVACRGESGQVELGDVIMSVTPSSSWSDKWLEPNGDEISIAAYPDLFAIIGYIYGTPSAPGLFKLPDLVSAPNNQNYLRARTNTGFLTPVNINGGSVLRTLDENDLPKHIHTVTGSTTSTGTHAHTFDVWDNGTPNQGKVDGSPGNNGATGFTTPNGGGHNHTISGTTNDFGVDVPNPVWNTNTSVTPRYTNVYLKMRVK